MGPLVVAALVSLVAIGAYILLTGGKDDPDTTQTVATPPVGSAGTQSPPGSNPDAATGLALADGAYRCYQADSADLKPLAAVADKLVVPLTRGVYTWNGREGTYTIVKNSLSTDTEIFADVRFTDGPLKDVKALFFNRVRQGDAGKDAGGLTFEDGTNRWCAIN
jgi:integrin beta 3